MFLQYGRACFANLVKGSNAPFLELSEATVSKKNYHVCVCVYVSHWMYSDSLSRASMLKSVHALLRPFLVCIVGHPVLSQVALPGYPLPSLH